MTSGGAGWGTSLEWKLDWAHRYGLLREPAFPVIPFGALPRPPTSEVARTAASTPPVSEQKQQELEAIDDSEEQADGAAPMVMLAKPSLTRSETKTEPTVKPAAQSDLIEEGLVGEASAATMQATGRPLAAEARGVEAVEQPSPQRVNVIDNRELSVAPAKETGRHNVEDKSDSLDPREMISRLWEHRYGVPKDMVLEIAPMPHTAPPSVVLGPVSDSLGGTACVPALPAATMSVGVALASTVVAIKGSMCQHCEEQSAGVSCPACGSAYFCVECDAVLHRAAKMRHHVRRRMSGLQEEDSHGGLLGGASIGAGNLEIDRDEIRIMAKLGEGYFGVVYKGLWAGQSVAVKKLKHGTRRQVKEFKNEIMVLSKLRHPNITMFYGVALAPEWLIITELLHCSLHKLLHNRDSPRYLPPVVLRRIAKDIACGGAYIHGLNPPIVHRDVNASNVLLTGDIRALERIVAEGRDEPLAKLSDFGLSRSVERFMTQATGNCYYLAPEVFRGQHYTEKADIYSYGILLWEIFSRQYPFMELNPRSAAFQQAEMGLRPPTSGKDLDLDPLIVTIMQKAWTADPDTRPPFKDILEIWRALERAGESPIASPSLRGMGFTDQKMRSAMMVGLDHEYCLTPMDWRRQMLHEKLVRRPSLFELMRGSIVKPSSSDISPTASTSSGGEKRRARQMFGYDLLGVYLRRDEPQSAEVRRERRRSTAEPRVPSVPPKTKTAKSFSMSGRQNSSQFAAGYI